MHESLRILRLDSPLDAKCIIEVDEYIPLRFRAYDRPLGSNYVRIGDQTRTLAEFLVDPESAVLRGITITSFVGVAAWPSITIQRHASTGLPAFAASWGKANRIDIRQDFSVSARDTEIVLFWHDLEGCEAVSFLDRVSFLIVSGELAGVEFAGFSPEEMRTFMSHAQSD